MKVDTVHKSTACALSKQLSLSNSRHPGGESFALKSDQATIVKNTPQSIESSLQQATDE